MNDFDIGVKNEVEIMKRALFQHKYFNKYVISVDFEDLTTLNYLYKTEFKRVFGKDYTEALELCNYETYDVLNIVELKELLEN